MVNTHTHVYRETETEREREKERERRPIVFPVRDVASSPASANAAFVLSFDCTHISCVCIFTPSK